MKKVIVAGLLVVMIGVNMPAIGAAPKSHDQSHAATAKELSLVKAAFANKLKDPFSMKLSKVRVKTGEVCGYVNAKNSYGAYTGFQKFFGLITPNKDTHKDEFYLMAMNSDNSDSADGYCTIMGYNE